MSLLYFQFELTNTQTDTHLLYAVWNTIFTWLFFVYIIFQIKYHLSLLYYSGTRFGSRLLIQRKAKEIFFLRYHLYTIFLLALYIRSNVHISHMKIYVHFSFENLWLETFLLSVLFIHIYRKRRRDCFEES